MVYWFSADFGVTETDGAISEWRDRSGNEEHAEQRMPPTRPKLGRLGNTELPALAFDGEDDHFVLPPHAANLETGLTYFAVARLTAEAGNTSCRSMLELSNGSEHDDIGFFVYSLGFSYEIANSPLIGQQDSLVLGQTYLLDLTHGSDLAVASFMNGLPADSASFGLPVQKTRHQNFIGRSLYPQCATTGWSGEIAEILLYARPLPAPEREAVRRYLDQKWGGCCLDAR